MADIGFVYFANDTAMCESDGGYSVNASALGIDADAIPAQLVVNGCSYSYVLTYDGDRFYVMYRRDHDGATLRVDFAGGEDQ